MIEHIMNTLKELTENQRTLEDKIDTIEDKVDTIEDKFDTIEDKVDISEDEVETIGEKFVVIKESITENWNQVGHLESDHLRLSNLVKKIDIRLNYC